MLEGFAYCKMVFDGIGRPADFVYLDVNTAFGQLTGLKDVVGKRVTEVIPGIKEQNPEIFEAYGRVALTGKPETLQVDLKALDMILYVSVYSPMKGYFVAVFENITERKKAEEATSRLAALVDSSDDAIISKTLDGVITSWNHGAEKLYGYSADEVKGKSIGILTPPGHHDELKHVLEDLKKGQLVHYETQRLRKDGKTIDVSLTISPIKDSRGRIVGASTIAHDITHRKLADRKLRESEERYRTLFNNVNEALFFVDGEGRFLDINDLACERLGYSREELLKMSLSDINLPEKGASIKQQIQTIQERGRAVFESRHVRRDGSSFPVEISARAISYRGKPTLLGISRDITVHKRTEQELRQSEERYHSLIDRMLEGVYRSTHEGKFLDVNPAFVRMFGYSSKQEMLDIPNIAKALYFSPEDRKELAPDTAQKGGMQVFRMRRKDGSVIWVEDYGIYLHDEGGRVTYHEGILHDITERKEIEDRLRESESRYRSLFDRMLDGVYRSTHQGRFVDINPAFVKMFGFSSKQEMLDIPNISKALYFSPEERGSYLLDTGQEEQDVYRMRKKDGSEIWVEDHGHYVHDEKGNILYHEGILRDVTERKRTEQRLKLQSQITENMFEGIVLVRAKDGKIVYTNPRFDDMFGYAAGELIGKSILPLNAHTSDKTAEDLETEIFRGLNAIGTWTGEIPHVKRDGTIFWCRANISTLETSEYGRILVQAQEDISERKNLEAELEKHTRHLEELVEARTEELAASEEKYRELFVSSPISLWEEDFSAANSYLIQLQQRGIVNLKQYLTDNPDEVAKCSGMVKVLSVNDATLKLYGAKSAQEIVRLNSVLDKGSLQVFTDELVAFADGRTEFTAQIENVTLGGEPRYVNLICTVVPGYEETLSKVLVSVVDLTTQTKLEQELLKSQRLAAIGETAAMVGHDLRNPLQAMTSSLYLAKRLIQSPTIEDKEEAEVLLDKLDTQVIYMDKIVSDLQNYSGPVKPELVETDLTELINEIMPTVAAPGNVETQLVSPDVTPTVQADPMLMRRVMVNLLTNAVQAMPNGGKLTITLVTQPNALSMAVQDTGQGIAPENLSKMFTPFFTKKAKGQGLGLAVCKRLVEAQGGTIAVQSLPGRGSVFTVTLPLKRVNGVS
jgi:PAS domain S-box-containing protein